MFIKKDREILARRFCWKRRNENKIVLLHDDEWSSEVESSQHGECDDLLIAADGMNSAVKRHFRPTEAA